MPFPAFDRSKIHLRPLSQRHNGMDLSHLLPLSAPLSSYTHAALPILAQKLVSAKKSGSSRLFVMGAHVIRAGVSRYIIDMMQRGLISHLAMNGAGPIHDWELSLIGATTESVAHYIQTGEFGLWKETGQMNDAITLGASDGLGLGEALGRAILNGHFPYKDVSLLAAAVRLNVPVTVHVGIGYDIIHEHPNCDGAALGQTSYQDFLIFTQSVAGLENGVFLSLGSAVMGPEVYLKALSMARNVAFQQGRAIRHFATGVFDLLPLHGDLSETAPKTDPRYYYRPWKTILVRTVAEGGESHYVEGDHRLTVPRLYHEAINLK